MKRKLLFAALCALGAWVNTYAVDWTDKTSVINNPSFETDNAVSNATANALNSATVTGWTVLPTTTVSNAQAAVVNSSSTLSVLNGSDGATTGSKYFYVRQNWNNTGNFGIQQVIAAGQPAGLYMLTCKIKTSSSNPGSSSWTLSIQEGDKTAVTNTNAGSAAEWLNYGVLLYKESSETAITISAYMVAGASGNSQHYAMLLDDFQLKYISPDDFATVTEENPLDMTGAIYNEGIYNASKTSLPRGWQEYGRSGGNGNFTEGTGNTQLEGWAADNADFSRDYYQTINGLPEGKYKVTAYCHDTNNRGAYLYIFSNGARQSVNMPTAYTDITTPALNVSNGSINIGIKLENKKGTWMTGDNFRLTYIGSELNAKKLELRNLKTNVTDNYLNNSTYSSVVGSDRTALSTAAGATASEETVDAYQTVIDAITNARDNFVAHYNAYQALNNEITKATALGASTTAAESALADENRTSSTLVSAVQNLKVNEYTYVTNTYQYGVTLGTWTTTGPTGSLSAQHYKGEGYPYLEQSSAAWGQNSWTIKYAQDLTLPAGSYVFKVSGRKAASDGVTLGLTVTNKATSDVLGSVNDFPEGDTGLGINKDGVTSFDSEDAAGFANSGAGRGWEWRYVKFTLASDATVNVSVDAVATTSHMWVSFCDATVQTDDEANISLIAYNIALGSAQTIIADEQYNNVIGSERTTLQAAIAADGTLDKTDKDAIDAATTALDEARTAFTGAKSSYDAYVAAKAFDYQTLAYAATAKRTALDNAQAATATSATDADAKKAAIITAARQYYESHALAEGVTGKEDKTSLITDPNLDVTIAGMTAGAWAFNQGGGTAEIRDAESFTDGDGNSDYKYFYYNNGDNNNQHLTQTISGLPAGNYLLTVTARANTNFNNYFYLKVTDGSNNFRENIPAIGNTGGIFDGGWNDANLEFVHATEGDVTLEVYSDGGSGNAKRNGWWSATRFRLVRLGDASTSLTITYAGWATLYTAKALDFSGVEGLTAYTAALEDSKVKLTAVSDVPANTGVVLKGAAGSYNIPWAASSETAKGDLEGNATEATAYGSIVGKDLYYLALNGEGDAQFTKLNEGGSIAAGKAFLPVTAGSLVKAFTVIFDDADAIGDVRSKMEDGRNEIFNLAGQRMSKMQKGINIVNGKKILVK